jgi:hypothetical protein
MRGLSRASLLAIVRRMWEERDPVPAGLVARMRAAAAGAAADLDTEPMRLVERSTRSVGAPGTEHTLRFEHRGIDLLLRVVVDGDRSCVEGWVTPPEPMTIRARAGEQRVHRAVVVGESGRFELTDLPSAVLRLWLEPHDAARPTLATPAVDV